MSAPSPNHRGERDTGLFQLGLAVVGQQLVMLLVRLISVHDVVFSGRPAIVSRPPASRRRS